MTSFWDVRVNYQISIPHLLLQFIIPEWLLYNLSTHFRWRYSWPRRCLLVSWVSLTNCCGSWDSLQGKWIWKMICDSLSVQCNMCMTGRACWSRMCPAERRRYNRLLRNPNTTRSVLMVYMFLLITRVRNNCPNKHFRLQQRMWHAPSRHPMFNTCSTFRWQQTACHILHQDTLSPMYATHQGTQCKRHIRAPNVNTTSWHPK